MMKKKKKKPSPDSRLSGEDEQWHISDVLFSSCICCVSSQRGQHYNWNYSWPVYLYHMVFYQDFIQSRWRQNPNALQQHVED